MGRGRGRRALDPVGHGGGLVAASDRARRRKAENASWCHKETKTFCVAWRRALITVVGITKGSIGMPRVTAAQACVGKNSKAQLRAVPTSAAAWAAPLEEPPLPCATDAMATVLRAMGFGGLGGRPRARAAAVAAAAAIALTV